MSSKHLLSQGQFVSQTFITIELSSNLQLKPGKG